MTVKGRHALRKLGTADTRELRRAAWIRGDFPSESVHAALAGAVADLDAFDQFFCSQLKRFRTTEAFPRRTPAYDLQIVSEAGEYVEETRKRLGCLPGAALATIAESDFERGELGKFNRELEQADEVLGALETRLVEMHHRLSIAGPGNPGAPTKHMRDWLLANVADWLQSQSRIGAIKAAGLASDCLRAVDIPAPTHPSKARERILVVKKQYPILVVKKQYPDIQAG